MTIPPGGAARRPRSVRIVGRGRAGGAFDGALRSAGWAVDSVGHDDPVLEGAAGGVDVLLLCVPDAAIEATAGAVEPVPSTVVAHCSGASGLDVLQPHTARASVHPLVSLPDATLGARRLRGAWFAVAGAGPGADAVARDVVEALDGRAVEVPDDSRVRYHAAAVVASNHLVALLGQVERIAADVGVPLEAFLDLARGSLDNVAELGPAAALTGPVARGDLTTVRAHLGAIAPEEREAYRAMAVAAGRLVGRNLGGALTPGVSPGAPPDVPPDVPSGDRPAAP